jgi:squalene cyclase
LYSSVNSENAINWVLAKANSISGLNVVKKRELGDNKLILLLAAVGYVVGIGNVWCLCTGGWVVAEG